MAVNDRREPGVYITVEDKSYVAPALETGRTVYGVVLTDRGPHNRIVNITSKEQFYRIFGTPNFRRTSQTMYQLDQALSWTSSAMVCRVVPEDSYWANSAVRENTGGNVTASSFTFTTDSNEVICADVTGYNTFEIGQWIYSSSDTVDEALQVIGKDDTNEIYKLTLSGPYAGSTGSATAMQYTPYDYESMTNVDSEDYFVDPHSNICFYFYATGAGSYYNRLVIRGTRNTDMEKYIVDQETGRPLYKYMFMNLGVYEVQTNGNLKLLEGPFTVSLIPRWPTADEEAVKDLTTGSYLFIEEVINKNSDLVRCVATMKDAVTGEPAGEFPAVTKMISAADAENRRLQVMLMLSQSSPLGTTNVMPNANTIAGLCLENGTDGTGMYDAGGNLNPNDQLLGRVGLAYNGSLTSVDGSIEELLEVVYPVFSPDYVVCGGFPATIEYNAMQLCENRGDCLCLADTGSYTTKYAADLTARLDDVPWNTWNAALYVQWRKVFDNHTGQDVWMSPIYHAIARHLACDAEYFVAEPVAGITKGAIEESMNLAYIANHTERGDLLESELNPTIVEPQGKYFLTQFTTWKALSVLKRLHVAKFVMVRK